MIRPMYAKIKQSLDSAGYLLKIRNFHFHVCAAAVILNFN